MKPDRLRLKIKVVCFVLMFLGGLSFSIEATTRSIVTFGATPNDASDDTLAILNTMNASSAGDTVLVPMGIFNISSQLEWKSGVNLVGSDRAGSILQVTGGTMTRVFNLHGGNNIAFSNLTLDGGNINVFRDAIYVVNTTNLSMTFLNIRNFMQGNGIYVRACTNNTITDNYLLNIGLGAGGTPSSNQYAAIWVQSLSPATPIHNTKILRNVTENTGWQGIWCSDWTRDTVISDNTIKGSAQVTGGYAEGMHLGGHDNQRMLVENNTADRFLSLSSNGEYYSKDIVFRGNTVVRTAADMPSYAGIEIVGFAENLIITDNYCALQSRGFAITEGGTKNAYIAHNICTNNTDYAFAMGASATEGYQEIYIRQNSFVNTTGPGIGMLFIGNVGGISYLDLDSNTISNNLSYYALQFNDGANSSSFTIAHNFIQNNAQNAQNYPANTPLEWTNNTVTGNGNNAVPTSFGFSGNPRPTVNFSYVTSGLTAIFTNTSSGATKYLWDFDSGLGSTTTNPTYAYPAPGTYRVALVGWSATGRGGVKEVYVTVPTSPPILQSAVSRLTHGSAGTFDRTLALTGGATIEPRRLSTGNFSMVFTFDQPVSSASASLTGSGSISGAPIASGNTLTVNLASMTNAQTATINLTNIVPTAGGTNGSAALTFKLLQADQNFNSGVTASDVLISKSKLGLTVDATTAPFDVNASGSITAADVLVTKSVLGTVAP